jgi:hypothetical protein
MVAVPNASGRLSARVEVADAVRGRDVGRSHGGEQVFDGAAST